MTRFDRLIDAWTRVIAPVALLALFAAPAFGQAIIDPAAPPKYRAVEPKPDEPHVVEQIQFDAQPMSNAEMPNTESTASREKLPKQPVSASMPPSAANVPLVAVNPLTTDADVQKTTAPELIKSSIDDVPSAPKTPSREFASTPIEIPALSMIPSIESLSKPETQPSLSNNSKSPVTGLPSAAPPELSFVPSIESLTATDDPFAVEATNPLDPLNPSIATSLADHPIATASHSEPVTAQVPELSVVPTAESLAEPEHAFLVDSTELPIDNVLDPTPVSPVESLDALPGFQPPAFSVVPADGELAEEDPLDIASPADLVSPIEAQQPNVIASANAETDFSDPQNDFLPTAEFAPPPPNPELTVVPNPQARTVQPSTVPFPTNERHIAATTSQSPFENPSLAATPKTDLFSQSFPTAPTASTFESAAVTEPLQTPTQLSAQSPTQSPPQILPQVATTPIKPPTESAFPPADLLPPSELSPPQAAIAIAELPMAQPAVAPSVRTAPVASAPVAPVYAPVQRTQSALLAPQLRHDGTPIIAESRIATVAHQEFLPPAAAPTNTLAGDEPNQQPLYLAADPKPAGSAQRITNQSMPSVDILPATSASPVGPPRMPVAEIPVYVPPSPDSSASVLPPLNSPYDNSAQQSETLPDVSQEEESSWSELKKWAQPEQAESTFRTVGLLTVISLAPAILLMTTSFIRISVVLGLLRQAIGTQMLPSNQIVTSLAMFLTALVMAPVWQQVYDEAIVPYTEQSSPMTAEEAWDIGVKPVRAFMSRQIEMAKNSEDVLLFYSYLPDASQPPETYEDVPLRVLLPAFMISELKIAFLIGFQIYLPFLIIDLVVSSVTVSMGMMMLPPVTISLPLKLLLFVLVDGWHLVVGMLLQSFGGFS